MCVNFTCWKSSLKPQTKPSHYKFSINTGLSSANINQKNFAQSVQMETATVSNEGLCQQKKALMLDPSPKTKERLARLDLNKIQNNFYDKLSRVYDHFKQITWLDRNNLPANDALKMANDCQLAKETRPAAGVEGDEVFSHPKHDEMIQNNFMDNVDEALSTGDMKKRNKEKEMERLKKITYETYRKCLQSYGYKSVGSNWFLAEGGFGAVFRVEKKGVKYAVKVVSNVLFKIKYEKKNFNTVKMRSRFYNEVDIMKQVSHHPNIIKLIDCFEEDIKCSGIMCPGSFTTTDQNDVANDEVENCAGEKTSQNDSVFKNYFIVMEYADSKTLSYHLRKYRSLDEMVVKEIFSDVISAVRFLHKNRIAHRDIKLSNLLLQRKRDNNGHAVSRRFNFKVKLCDFGLSTVVDDNEEEDAFLKPVGTSLYMAPEILRAYYFYSEKDVDMIAPYSALKGDVWALGVCMYYCLHGCYPLDLSRFNSKQERLDALREIFLIKDRKLFNEKDYVLDYSKNIYNELRNYNCRLSANCKDVLSRMLNVDPNKRANIDDLFHHCYFQPVMMKNSNRFMLDRFATS